MTRSPALGTLSKHQGLSCPLWNTAATAARASSPRQSRDAPSQQRSPRTRQETKSGPVGSVMTCGSRWSSGEMDGCRVKQSLQFSVPNLHRGAVARRPALQGREIPLECRRWPSAGEDTHRSGLRGLRRRLVRGCARRHQPAAPAEAGPGPERRGDGPGGRGDASAARQRSHATDSGGGAGHCPRGADRPTRMSSLRLAQHHHRGSAEFCRSSRDMRHGEAAWLLLTLALVVVRHTPRMTSNPPPPPCPLRVPP